MMVRIRLRILRLNALIDNSIKSGSVEIKS